MNWRRRLFRTRRFEFQKWGLIAQWGIGLGQIALIGGGIAMMQLAGRRRDRALDQMMTESRRRHEEAMAAHAQNRAALEAVIEGLRTVIERVERGKE